MYQVWPGAPATFLHFELTVNTSRIEYTEWLAAILFQFQFGGNLIRTRK